VRLGFWLFTLNKKRIVMAHVDSDSAYRVGKYGVDVPAIDQAVQAVLTENSGTDLFIIDEIGKMECFSDLFIKKMTSLLDSGKPVVATVALKGGGFIGAVKKRSGIVLWEITKKNRDEIVERIAGWARGRN
jgi:nucleoside-triphosphatase